MVRSVRLLDLFCGAGGAAMGYSRAGFDHIVGVDIRPQPNYPFTFVKDDAFKVLAQLQIEGGRGPFSRSFDVIHASPPCQTYSRTRKILEGKGLTPKYSDMLSATRIALRWHPFYVIENVMGAPLRWPICLCGTMFGLRVLRHRYFECSVVVIPPCFHPAHDGKTNSHRGYSTGGKFITVGGHNYNPTEGRAAMGIDWMTRNELNEAIPPAYTEFIGRQLMQALTS